jgi:diguanylate cyclase (GGDEF)-like protein
VNCVAEKHRVGRLNFILHLHRYAAHVPRIKRPIQLDEQESALMPRAASLGVVLGVQRSADPHDGESLDRRLRGFGKLWPAAVLSTILSAVTVALSVSNVAATSALLGSILLSLLPCALFLERIGGRILPHWRVIAISSMTAGLGTLTVLLFVALADSPQQWVMTILIGATMTVVVAALSRLPMALLSYAAGVVGSALVAPGSAIESWIVAPSLGCVMVIAIIVAKADFALFRSLSQALEDSSRPSRLLGEVEEKGSVWFWETDRRGRLTYLSPKILNALGLSSTTVVGHPLTAIAADGAAVDTLTPVGERTLPFFLSTQTAFSELTIRAATTDERWWSISGRPVYDRFDQLRGYIGTGSDLTEIRRSEAEVSRLARFDPLTGLANRSEIGNLLRQALMGSSGTRRAASLFLIDLDRFKNVNDTLGHPAGDALLKQVAKRLVLAIGTNGHVGRLGGDEFQVVLQGNATRGRLESLAKSLIEAVSQPYLIDGAQVSIGASLGIAVAPQDGSKVDDLTRNADLALYAAKGAGRGVHVFYEPEMHSSANRRREIEADLAQALERNDLRLVYQPVVTCITEQVTGFEALLRWTHPIHGPISPAEFIPIAEESSLIERIGEWVLRRACEEAQSWKVPARVAVNVSPIQFANPAFPTLVAQVLAQTGLKADRLELEITEGVFIGEDTNADTLKRIGVRLALDDFGTGYSSLGYLQRAPLNKIKIDQSFVRGATLGNNQNAAIIKSIVTLAEALGMETTAEGAETEDEIELIRELGCSHIQGYYYGPPLEVSELAVKMGVLGSEPSKVGHKTGRSPRVTVLRRGTVTIGGVAFPMRLRNVSTAGAMIEMSHTVPMGEAATLTIQDGPTVYARIVWWSDNRCGLAFDEDISLDWIRNERPMRAFA